MIFKNNLCFLYQDEQIQNKNFQIKEKQVSAVEETLFISDDRVEVCISNFLLKNLHFAMLIYSKLKYLMLLI